ncbi:MAG: acyltransferase [Sphingomonas sp.]|jgi:peptidoglycan/LPS O-acetylase OafA/YrhL|uniref:acyltransferase family protein n=1 Tax=Sphingomonas sp. TaxID=28214 RepID=UPI003569E461
MGERQIDGKGDGHLVRLEVLRFPLIVLIVYLHACGVTANFADGARGLADARVVEDVQVFTGSISRIAVPLFFLMSGFLFFRGVHFSLATYRAKLQARARSLLLPFLFWNLALLALVAVAQSVPALAPLFNGQNLAVRSMSPFQMVDAVFGFTRYPIAYQFWFIRDLMILVIASPLIWAAARYLAKPTLIVLLWAWVFGRWPLLLPEGEPVLFFFVGAMVAIRGGSLFAVDRISWWIAPLFVLGLWGFYASHQTGWMNFLLRPAIAIGVVMALKASRWLAESDRWRDRLVRLGATSFFVFAVHEPLVTIGKKVAYRTFPMTAENLLVVYAVLPALIVAFALLAYWVLLKTMPGLLRFVTGGR